jgi:hypothetical protein
MYMADDEHALSPTLTRLSSRPLDVTIVIMVVDRLVMGGWPLRGRPYCPARTWLYLNFLCFTQTCSLFRLYFHFLQLFASSTDQMGPLTTKLFGEDLWVSLVAASRYSKSMDVGEVRISAIHCPTRVPVDIFLCLSKTHRCTIRYAIRCL